MQKSSKNDLRAMRCIAQGRHGGLPLNNNYLNESLHHVSSDLREKMKRAKELSWDRFGKKITFYLPGMISYDEKIGKYPAISITGNECKLGCEHCRGKLLEPMIKANTPEDLIILCRKLEKSGNIGVLLTGGSDKQGKMPWKEFAPAIKKIKESTNLKISIHTGIMDENTAKLLSDAGIDQALIDVIGSDQTVKDVYHLDDGVSLIERSFEALMKSGIDTVPHIVIGLHFGKILGEYKAIEMLKKYEPKTLVFVILTPFKGTSMENVRIPTALDVTEILCEARFQLPETILSLGCERPRNNNGHLMEIFAIESGINRIAIQSDYTIDFAERMGIEVEYKETCCSLF